MQMPHAGVQMQSLSMMVPVHIFNRDANVPLQVWNDANAPLWVCHDANVPLGM